MLPVSYTILNSNICAPKSGKDGARQLAWVPFGIRYPSTQDDQHLITFITPYGRYLYCTAPQGFISAGDAYTQRMDQIVEGTLQFNYCVDDSIL